MSAYKTDEINSVDCTSGSFLIWCCIITMKDVTFGGNWVKSTKDLPVQLYATFCESIIIPPPPDWKIKDMFNF